MFPLNTAGRIGLNIALLLAGVLALHFGKEVIVPILIALLLATVLAAYRPSNAQNSLVPGLRHGRHRPVLANLVGARVFRFGPSSINSRTKSLARALQGFRAKLQNVAIGELDTELLPEAKNHRRNRRREVAA